MARQPAKFEIAGLTHRGVVRDHNEDTVAIDATVLTGDLTEPFVTRLSGGRHLLVVADGMGGHSRGELASRSAVEALTSAIFSDEAGCREALAAANDHLYDLMHQRSDSFAMGTTVVGAVLAPDRAVVFNVGDSRAYAYRPGELAQLSHDDVPGGAGRGPRSHLLTQCLGGHFSPVPIEPHICTLPGLEPGEALLLCSDGLTDMADDDDIAEVLATAPDPAQAVQALSDLAMDRGGIDNISLVLARAAAKQD